MVTWRGDMAVTPLHGCTGVITCPLWTCAAAELPGLVPAHACLLQCGRLHNRRHFCPTLNAARRARAANKADAKKFCALKPRRRRAAPRNQKRADAQGPLRLDFQATKVWRDGKNTKQVHLTHRRKINSFDPHSSSARLARLAGSVVKPVDQCGSTLAPKRLACTRVKAQSHTDSLKRGGRPCADPTPRYTYTSWARAPAAQPVLPTGTCTPGCAFPRAPAPAGAPSLLLEH